jgi:hypothetical protein
MPIAAKVSCTVICAPPAKTGHSFANATAASNKSALMAE